MSVSIKVRKIRHDAKKPIRASDGAVGYDVYASRILDKHTKRVIGQLPIILEPNENVLIGIGVQMAIPWPWQCEVRPRSGLASKYDIELGNSPGTVDPDFRGEAGVLLRNRSKVPFKIEKNMRIAQLVFSLVETPELIEAKKLPATRRGGGGFGSTGLMGAGLGTDDFNNARQKIDQSFMKIAEAVAELSVCPNKKKFGAIVIKDGVIISQGVHNHVNCDKLDSCECEVHAEMHALANLAKSRGSARSATLYTTSAPCKNCCLLIITSGIETLIIGKRNLSKEAKSLLDNAGVEIRFVK